MLQIVVILFIIALLGSFVKNKKYNSCIAGGLLVFMGLICAFRARDVGVDTQTYLQFYNRPELFEKHVNEFLYYIIVKLFYFNKWGNQWCQSFISVITYLPLIWVITRKTKNACLAVLILIVGVNAYFFETFNIVRQTAATSFLLCFYVWLSESKYKLAAIAMVCAIGMHSSTLIYIPFIVLAWKFEFSPKFVYICIGVSLIFAFLMSSVSVISNLITKFASYDIGGTEKYAKFVSYRLDMAKNINGLVTLLLPFSALCVYAYKWFKNSIMMRIFFLGCVFLNIVSIMPTSYRMAYGMTCLEIFIFPMIYSSEIKHKWIPSCLLVAIIFLWFWKLEGVLLNSDLIIYNSFDNYLDFL
ncbi:MAG: EpsG family protein [Muribaculum sp.]|nr:EpsG family protein [Muribaculum sp.]